MDKSILIKQLIKAVGKSQVITDPSKTLFYRKGYRFGEGNALAVVKPKTLLAYWNALKACVDANVIVISQSANTGLTGGSTPDGNDYDRDVVIINTLLLNGIQLIENNTQVVCLAGATLYELEDRLRPLHREPHSVIGSSCIGASVVGGVCNNSGGALVQRGPAYTEMALFAQINEKGALVLKNHLGIDLGETPEEILTHLEKQQYMPQAIHHQCGQGSDHAYCHAVRDVDANTPARFNADPRRHYEASGCAGKLAVFAVRLDTFPMDNHTAVFYIGTREISTLNAIRRQMLTAFETLPISGEYIHRDAYALAKTYGKDTFWVIKTMGTKWLPKLFALKAKVDRMAERIPFMPAHFSDKFLQFCSVFIPHQLPAKMDRFHQHYDHHLILKVGEALIEPTRQFLKDYFSQAPEKGDYFECNEKEAQSAMLHRFAVASAGIRYHNIHQKEVGELLALDIALRRNDQDWFEHLPAEINDKILHKLYYGHFMCHVFHQDYILKKGVDAHQLEAEMLKLLDERGAEYPAEHNVGHLYEAKPALKAFYYQLDPTNGFNAGIGQTSKNKNWQG